MKVVLVSSVAAFPTNAGNRSRVLGLASAIQKLGHELTFVLLPSAFRDDEVDIAAHENAFGAANVVCLGAGRLSQNLAFKLMKLPLQVLRKALKTMNLNFGFYSGLDQRYPAHWNAELAKLGQDADVALVEYAFNSKAFQAFPKSALRILDTHDSFAERHQPYRAQGLKSGYWISLRTSDENRAFRRAHRVLAIQEDEAVKFRDQLGSGQEQPAIDIVSHFIDTDTPINSFATDGAAVFLGSGNPSNTHSIKVFIAQTLPKIVAQRPGFQLHLVGSICKQVDNHPNVVKRGRVDDLNALFNEIPLSVNPMLVGTGIAIKLLDAMALGVGTISTETGARGLPENMRQGVVTVSDDDTDGLAQAIITHIDSAQARETLGRGAYQSGQDWNAMQIAALRHCLEAQLTNGSDHDH